VITDTSRNLAVLGVALVAVFLALERISWWMPEWLLAYGARAIFATSIAWLLVQNVVIFALVGALLTAMLRGSSSALLAMLFGLLYGAARLIAYALGILPGTPFWLHPFVLATAGISPLIGTTLGALAFRRLNRNRTHAA
jgi:hypothetical protein